MKVVCLGESTCPDRWSGSQVALVTHTAEMQPALGFSVLVASKASSEDTQFSTKMCFGLLGMGVFFIVTFRSCPFTSCQGPRGTDESLGLCHSSGGALGRAWVLLLPTSLQYLLYHIASEILGWTWRIKWHNYKVEEKNTYVVAVID